MAYFLIVAIVFLMQVVSITSHAGLVLERQNGDSERELWTKLDRLSEVKALMQDGEYDQARILLDAANSNFPGAREVKGFYKMLDEAEKGNAPAGDNVNIATKANAMWMKYEEYKSEGNLSAARNTLLKIREIYRDGFMPEFLSGFDKEMADTEKGLEARLSGKLRDAWDKVSAAFLIASSEGRLMAFVSIYGEAQDLLAENRNFAPIVELRENVFAELEKTARVIYAKNDTVRSLEGCEAAQPGFGRLLDILRYPEVEFYQRVKDEMELCKR